VSRGLGKVQRAALAIVESEDRAFRMREITAGVFGALTFSRIMSTQRALTTLAKAGKVCDLGRGIGRHRYWVSDRAFSIAAARAWQHENLVLITDVESARARFATRSPEVIRGLEMQSQRRVSVESNGNG
jgi:hypothetical protein